nr:hypothetical protein CFP56_06256 [Quercus suber]
MKAIGTRAQPPNSQGRFRGEAEHAMESETVRSQQRSGRVPDEDDDGSRDAVARVSTITQVAGMDGNHGIIPEVALPNSKFQGEKIIEIEGLDGLMLGGDNLSLSGGK